MKKKISELELWEIDYLIAKLAGFDAEIYENQCCVNDGMFGKLFDISTNPVLAWPIIESERISIEPIDNDADNKWLSIKGELIGFSYGKTSLESAMRCYLASKVGDEAEV